MNYLSYRGLGSHSSRPLEQCLILSQVLSGVTQHTPANKCGGIYGVCSSRGHRVRLGPERNTTE